MKAEAAVSYQSLSAGQSLDRWNLSDPEVVHFPGQARPMPDGINYRFENGWVLTGDLPCRQAWREQVKTRQIALKNRKFPSIHISAGDPRVDFSTFCHQPTVVSRWARCVLRVASRQTLSLRARTCGGMRVWCNDLLVLVHEPYTRNRPAEQCFDATVDAGVQVITVYLDDLHERDTSCFFELTLLEGQGVESGLVTRSDPLRLAEAEQMMAGLRTEHVFNTAAMVCITSDCLPREPMALSLQEDRLVQINRSASAILEQRQPSTRQVITLGQSLPPAEVKVAGEFTSGCPVMSWQCTVGDVALYRRIGTSVLGQGIELSAGDANGRYRQVLSAMRRHMRSVPAHALVMLHQNAWDEHAQRNLNCMLDIVQARDDCADFHMMTLVWIAGRYASCLSADNERRLRQALLGFRYWLDEPGNDVMWFWSENHVLCFHVAQYLAGSLYDEECFHNSGKSGCEHARQALARLHRWFDAVDEHGLAEWNSAAYYPIDLRALFTLVANAPDPAIAGRARVVIDRLFTMIALHTINGVPTGSQGRAYEKELLAGPATELGAVAAVAFGGRWYPGHDTAAAMLAVSGYRLPPGLGKLLQVPEGQSLLAEYQQGLDGSAHLSLWKTADVQLSSVSDHRSGLPGHQQHLVDLHLAAHPHAGIWVNHPGELRVWGEGRPSYWSGNGVLPKVAQHGDMALMIYDLTLQPTDIGFTHLFCPQDVMDEIDASLDSWLFASVQQGYAAVFASGTLEPVVAGLYAGSEWRLKADVAGWVLIAGSAAEYADFHGFKRSCLARAPVFDSGLCSLSVTPRGSSYPVSLAFDAPLASNGAPLPGLQLGSEPRIQFSPLCVGGD
ncbi:MAG: hypothetical protein HKN42_08175 [Granulosicoccus sp.]|nr:hypothetical protein [Granulosicoccus sp.]